MIGSVMPVSCVVHLDSPHIPLVQDSCVPCVQDLQHPGAPLSTTSWSNGPPPHTHTSGACERHLNCSINCLCAEKQYLKERSLEDVTSDAAIIGKVAAN